MGSDFDAFWLPKCLPLGDLFGTKIHQQILKNRSEIGLLKMSSRDAPETTPRAPKTHPRHPPDPPKPPQDAPRGRFGSHLGVIFDCFSLKIAPSASRWHQDGIFQKDPRTFQDQHIRASELLSLRASEPPSLRVPAAKCLGGIREAQTII